MCYSKQFSYSVVVLFATIRAVHSQDNSQPVSPKPAAVSASHRRQPQPQLKYQLEIDSKKQDGVPEGRLEGPILFHSKIIANTTRQYWVSVPAQYDPQQPACVLVFQDGARAINPKGVLQVPQVLENLVAKRKIPVTIGIYVTPGHKGLTFPDRIGTDNPDNRDLEYDVLDDNYARMIVEEILPEVAAKYNLTKDPAGRAIGGSSSGGICAFTVAWHKPDQFRNVISLIGSFTDIHGGHVYPKLIGDSPAKPIRIFLQDGKNDNRNPREPNRDWFLQNQAMVAALTEKHYEMAHVFGEGGHSDDHGGAILPEMLQWIWRDYPGVTATSADELVAEAKRRAPITVDPFPHFDANISVSPVGKWKWENNGNRGRRTEVLTIEGERDQWHGTLATTATINGEPQTTTVGITSVEMVGNKLIFDALRTFRENKFTVTFQGIVNGRNIVGWSLLEMNGAPRDSGWRADRISDTSAGPTSSYGDFTNASDIGPVRKPGLTTYDLEKRTYELAGSGSNMWADKDEFHMAWKTIKGDFILEADLKLVGDGGDPHRKLGWMVRQSLDTNSAYADATIHGDGTTALQFRRTAGAKTEQVPSDVKGPNVVRLTRKGSKISMAVAKSGDELKSVDAVELDLGDEVYVGLFVCSHSADRVERGIFSNVRITLPPTAKASP